jgi:hypothetical protein
MKEITGPNIMNKLKKMEKTSIGIEAVEMGRMIIG